MSPLTLPTPILKFSKQRAPYLLCFEKNKHLHLKLHFGFNGGILYMFMSESPVKEADLTGLGYGLCISILKAPLVN